MSISSIKNWHERARPNPTAEEFSIQLGCHFEEVAEMMETVTLTLGGFPYPLEPLTRAITTLATYLKAGKLQVEAHDRKAFLDAIADQIVTGIGAAHCAGMDVVEALDRVDESNWSKFDENGQPMFDANGKIMKGPDYEPVNLEGLY